MKSCFAFVLAGFLATPCAAPTHQQSDSTCPVTVGSDSLGPPFPESENWYGSESLAVVLPENGKWGTTGPNARIAVKLFVWSIGFKPGAEQHLSVEIESLSGGPHDAVVNDVTNAGASSLGGWTMLAGIDFPSPGCWRLTLDYLGQSLSFVVETVDWTSGNTALAGPQMFKRGRQ
jgi:hypothetical protein